MLRFRSTGRSHAGRVRGNNEDAGFAGPYLQLVCDGVGGAAAGEVAAATTAYVVAAMAALRRDEAPLRVLESALVSAHDQLRLGTAADATRRGMSTTLTALFTDGRSCALAHVGDSRAYLLRDGGLVPLTRDHTLVQHLLDEGLVSPEEAWRHPRRNVVLRVVDGDTVPDTDLRLVELRPGDRLLVCSDGLTDLVEERRIALLLDVEDAGAAADALVEAALAAGGRDNVTCVVSDVVDGPRIVPDGKHLGAFADPFLVVDPAAVHAVGA
jgi:PPM family protein phosphatase